MNMRIGVDARPLSNLRGGGISIYVQNMLQALAERDHENEYILYSHRNFEFHGPDPRWRKQVGSERWYGTLWMEGAVPFLASRDKLDIFWATQHLLPLCLPSKIGKVVTVHDLVYKTFPGTMHWKNRWLSRALIPASLKQADAIVSDSKSTASDLWRFFGLGNSKVQVVYPVLEKQFFPRDPQETASYLQKACGMRTPYVLTVGTLEPRKNLTTTLKAFALFIKSTRWEGSLAVVGPMGWQKEKMEDLIKFHHLEDRAFWTGYVTRETVPWLYSGASAFLFPSLYEGFGFPPLEAMACGTPVICSNTSSLPEVVGDAAILVNPLDATEMAKGLETLLLDPNPRRIYIERGLWQVERFSWNKSADELLAVFRRVYEEKRGIQG